MAVTKFQARHATVAYATGAITWDTSTPIDEESMTSVAEVKDITISPPEHEVEQITCLGWYAQTIGANVRSTGIATGIVAHNAQLAALQATSLSNWKFEGTLVLTGDEQFQHVLGLDGGTAIDSTDHRYAVGNLKTTNTYFAKNKLGSMRIFFNNGSETMSVAMTNLLVTSIGQIKPTGSDGHFEVTFACECLPKDGAIEWAD